VNHSSGSSGRRVGGAVRGFFALICVLFSCPEVRADTAVRDPLEVLGVRQGMQISDAVPIPMRDGVRLSALVVHPANLAPGQKVPTIMIKTPYTAWMELVGVSEGSISLDGTVVKELLHRGYALVLVNDRGTGWSEGVFHVQKGSGADGYDTLTWIAAQPWSDGKVGTLGCSSSAENQWGLARLNHPAHKAMVVQSATAGVGSIPGYRGQGLFYIGGVVPLAWTWWYLEFGNQYHPHLPADIADAERARLAALYSSRSALPFNISDLSGLADHLPVMDILRAVNSASVDFDHLITLSPTDSEWNQYDFLREGESTRVPGLHIDSWYTFQAYGTARAFQYLSGNSPNQYLVMGPTSHCRMGTETAHTMVGTRDVGDARFDYASLIVNWFEHWLRGKDNATTQLPKVQYYTLGSSEWRSAGQWPVRGARDVKFFLGSDGSANSLFGNGRLEAQAPPGGSAYDQLVADPMQPVPSKGGGCCDKDVAQDQSSVEARNDVLVYTSKPLTEDLDVVGYITARLFLASSARDTDLMVKLVDVYPDQRAFNVLDSARRVRYRNGYAAPQLMEPSHIYPVEVDEMVTASRFAKGHRIRLEISGTNFPNYERNLNTGGKNYDETQPVVAFDKIYHDAGHRSYVVLPVLRPGN
jgi:uncharacterized protein